ncbi:hypothetical protein PVAP13_2KG118396 [Panicum virgatum]|uniref:Uncharacterized protein n=1 Tax=Panicum virgatum TaxID=38727 RepID=A0A8T0W826_PANVG|nr:hypothetical protein PVAP13_2KG118396 [Panicum virgatum]
MALHVFEPRRVAHPARQLATTILCLLRLLLLVATLISFSSHNRSIADGHNSKESGFRERKQRFRNRRIEGRGSRVSEAKQTSNIKFRD